MPPVRTTARVRPSQFNSVPRHARPANPTHPITRPYEAPQDIDAIRARTARNGYTGLEPTIALSLQECPFLGSPPNDEATTPLIRELDDNLLEAKDTVILDIDRYNASNADGQEGTRAAYVIYVTEHTVSLDHMALYVFPRFVEDGAPMKVRKELIDKLVREAQRLTGKFFFRGVKATRAAYNGDEFDCADGTQRSSIFAALFLRAPLAMTIKMLGTSGNHVDLENIFNHKTRTPVRKMWARAFQTLFVTACNAICDHIPGIADQYVQFKMKLWYEDWKTMVRVPEFVAAFPRFRFEHLPIKRNL